MKDEGMPVHLVSMKWFKRWCKYVSLKLPSSIDESSSPYNGDGGASTLQDSTSTNEGYRENSRAEDEQKLLSSSENINDDVNHHDGESEAVHPGPIDSDDMLSSDLPLIDPDKPKAYCNYLIKHGLLENKDFVILPKNVWNYLKSLYNGKELTRYIISINDETNQTTVEIWLKQVCQF